MMGELRTITPEELERIAPSLRREVVATTPTAVGEPFTEGGFGGKVSSNEVTFPPEASEAEATESESKSEPRRNEVWDVCEEVLGYGPKTDSEKALWGKMTSSLRRAGATTERVQAVADWYHRSWPDIDLTITALEKWYSHFLHLEENRAKRSAAVCVFCEMSAPYHADWCQSAKKT